MKRFYLLFLLVAFVGFGNTAQAQLDIALKHNVISDTMYYFNPVQRGHIIEWAIENTGMDTLRQNTDTFILARAYTPSGGSNRQRLFLPSDVAPGSSVTWRDTIGFTTPMGTPTFNWCDTIVGYRSTVLMSETNANNNRICKTIPFVEDPLTVSNVVAENSMKLYPNPASNNITINYNQTGAATNASVSITNLVGQKVLTQDIESKSAGQKQVTVDISALSAGIYVAELEINGVKTLSKFSVVK